MVQKLYQSLIVRGVQPAESLHSMILVGGLGKRLNQQRKLITAENFPHIDKKFHNQYGAKGMAILNLNKGKQTITDKHLQVYQKIKQIDKLTLALGCQPEIFEAYYKNSNIDFLIEKKPAGTIAPLVKLAVSGQLTTQPLIYANGDNLIDIDFYEAYLQGVLAAALVDIDINNLVIDILTQIPYSESMNYGTVDYNQQTQSIIGFYEKKPLQEGYDLDELVPINSGFSIICNPQSLISNHLDREVIEVSQALENGELNYNQYEKIVKYEIFYEKLAQKKLMVGVIAKGYWADLGTEDKVVATENYFNSLK